MRKFYIGNVVSVQNLLFGKPVKVLYVVKDSDRDTIQLLPFDASNAVHYIERERETHSKHCHCGDDDICPNFECDQCKGTGSVIWQSKCWDDYTLEAETIKEYITKSLLKGFEL